MAKTEKVAQQATRVWLHDPISVAHTKVSEKGVTYTVQFVDFMGLAREMKFDRDDCYFNFTEKVLKPMVQNGFRFNTMLPAAPAHVQAYLTAYKPAADVVSGALKKVQEEQKEEKAQAA